MILRFWGFWDLGIFGFWSCLFALASSPESDLTESAEITDLAEEREVKLPRWAESRNAWWEELFDCFRETSVDYFKSFKTMLTLLDFASPQT